MLVLERLRGQKIRILVDGKEIVLTVCKFRRADSGTSVKLGIEAPRDVKILRSEVADMSVPVLECAP